MSGDDVMAIRLGKADHVAVVLGDVATGQSGRYSDVPVEPVVIEKAEML